MDFSNILIVTKRRSKMGARLVGEEAAIRRSSEIPLECVKYISHHVRDGLVSIMGLAARIKDDPMALKELENRVMDIACDLEKVGL